MAKKPSNPQTWTDQAASITPSKGDQPSMVRPNSMDAARSFFADTDRNGESTRVTAAQASVTRDFRSLSYGEEVGSTIDVADPFGFGSTVSIQRQKDPWGINRPAGGIPDPNVGNPRP